MKTAATATAVPGRRDVPNKWRWIEHIQHPWPSVRADSFTEQELAEGRERRREKLVDAQEVSE